MGIGDEFGLKTVREIERSIPRVLGAASVQVLIAETREQIVNDVDRLLGRHLDDVRKHAESLVEVSLADARASLKRILEDDVDLLVDRLRRAAEAIVEDTLGRVEGTAAGLVERLATALEQQRGAIVLDANRLVLDLKRELAPVARELQHEGRSISNRALWIGIAVGLANFAGIVVGSLIVR